MTIKKPLLDRKSVVLVSGGARGITASCVVRLAEKAGCKFILLGRSEAGGPAPDWAADCPDDGELKKRIAADLAARGEKPEPKRIQKTFKELRASQEIHATLDAVRAAGGEAEYVSVDVANHEALEQKLAGPVHRLGRITGMIHGAGSLVDKRIEKKTESDFETVYAPKVTGLENMLSCVQVSNLDFLVLFSSIVGFFGNVGQSDYAIANEILNKSAYLIQKKHPDCRVISINWGPWDSGMVTPELKRVFESRNIAVIPTEVGAQMLVDELTNGHNPAVQVVVGQVPFRPVDEFSPELKSYHISRHLSLEANPFLFDHRIGEHPVLPATCAAAWVVNACEQLYPGYRFDRVANYRVLKGIVFNETLADEYHLDLREVAKTEAGEIEFDALIWSLNGSGKKLFHYSLRVHLNREAPPAPVYALPGAGEAVMDGLSLYHNGTLFHGPSFQGVERVTQISNEASHGRLTMRVTLPALPDEWQGQFPVITYNPYIYDAIVQSLLIWTQYFYGAPCLPASMKKLVQYKSIPFNTPCYVTMELVSQSETAIVANLQVVDEQGSAYVEIEALEGTVSKHLARLFGKPQETGA